MRYHIFRLPLTSRNEKPWLVAPEDLTAIKQLESYHTHDEAIWAVDSKLRVDVMATTDSWPRWEVDLIIDDNIPESTAILGDWEGLTFLGHPVIVSDQHQGPPVFGDWTPYRD